MWPPLTLVTPLEQPWASHPSHSHPRLVVPRETQFSALKPVDFPPQGDSNRCADALLGSSNSASFTGAVNNAPERCARFCVPRRCGQCPYTGHARPEGAACGSRMLHMHPDDPGTHPDPLVCSRATCAHMPPTTRTTCACPLAGRLAHARVGIGVQGVPLGPRGKGNPLDCTTPPLLFPAPCIQNRDNLVSPVYVRCSTGRSKHAR